MPEDADRAAHPSPPSLARDVFALVKIGIVGSNALTAMAGFALAAARFGRTGAARGAALWGAAALVFFGSSALVAGSCALNNWIDRDIDGLMERTKRRPTAAGRIGRKTALAAGLGLVGLGLALLSRLGPAPPLIGAAGVLIYVILYSLWAKRRTALSSFIGGVAGAIPPLVGWSAIDPRLGNAAWLLFALLILWQQAHVRALALRREREYGLAGLPMAGLHSPASDQRRRAERGLLLWVVILLLFSPLLLPLGPPAAVAAAVLAAAWLGFGLALGRRTRRPGWAGLMFAASLLYLVLVCAALLLSSLASP